MGQRTPSYSPPRRRGYASSRGRSPSPRNRYDSRGRDLPTSLLVRNIRRDCRPEDLRRPFGRFGPLKDVYLPRDYYTGEPRGFGFVQYVDPADAAEAKYYMNRQILHGREIAVVFAEERRKKPADMRRKERISHHTDFGRHYSSNDTRSPSPSRGYFSPQRDRLSRSHSPDERRYREYSHPCSRSRSPSDRRRASYSRSPRRTPSRSRSVSLDRKHGDRSMPRSRSQ